MGNITLTKTWVDAEVLNASDLNTNFTDVTDVVNGNIESVNIADSAIVADKIAAGAVTIAKTSNPYKAMAHLSTSQTMNDSSFTLISFDTEDYDTNNNFANTAGNYKYVAPITGYYLVNCNAYIKDVTEKAVVAGLQVLKNTTAISTQYQVPYPGSSVTTGWSIGYSQVVSLAAGDSISFKAWVDTSDSGTGAVIGGVDGSYCSFHLLSV